MGLGVADHLTGLGGVCGLVRYFRFCDALSRSPSTRGVSHLHARDEPFVTSNLLQKETSHRAGESETSDTGVIATRFEAGDHWRLLAAAASLQ